MTEIANPDNTLVIELEKEFIPVEGVEYDAYGNVRGYIPNYSSEEIVIKSAPVISPYVATHIPKSKVQPALDKKIIAFDTECTGISALDYRLLGGSFWDIAKPVSTMESFFGFDEEAVIKQIAEYLNREKPALMVDYNNGYDQIAILTRLMLYQVPVPGWNKIEFADMMEVFKKGTTQSIASSQSPGSEEAWLKFLFGESKPYTIEEIFEGVRNMNLQPCIIRNRTCVEGVGHMYLLFRYVTDEEPLEAADDKPTVVNIDEAKERGACLIACPACKAINQVDCSSKDNKCWRCMNSIPDPTDGNVVKEVLRPFDFSKVGLKASG